MFCFLDHGFGPAFSKPAIAAKAPACARIGSLITVFLRSIRLRLQIAERVGEQIGSRAVLPTAANGARRP
jgi:hypothetical protein